MAEKEKKEEKSFRSVFTQPGIKICKKFQKTKKYHCGYFYSQNKWGKAEKDRKKKSFR